MYHIFVCAASFCTHLFVLICLPVKKNQQSIASAFAKASKPKPKAKPSKFVDSDDEEDDGPLFIDENSQGDDMCANDDVKMNKPKEN